MTLRTDITAKTLQGDPAGEHHEQHNEVNTLVLDHEGRILVLETAPPTLTWPLDHTGATAAEDAVTLDATGDSQNRFVINHDGSIEWGSGSAVADVTLSRSGTRAVTLSGKLAINSMNDSDVPLAVKGFSETQTANLQEWQNYSGAQFGYMDPYGTMRARYFRPLALGANGYGYYKNYSETSFALAETSPNTSLVAGAANHIPLVVKAFSAQSANLQQWQNSSGVSQLKVDASGVLQDAAGTSWVLNQNPESYSVLTDGQTQILTKDANTIGLVVRSGAITPVANLIEWQNFSGNPIGGISGSGNFSSASFQVSSITGSYQNFNATSYMLYSNAGPNSLLVAANGVNVPLAVRGTAAQSGNLQEWQDTTPTTIAYVTPSGEMFATGFRTRSGARYYSAGGGSYALYEGASPNTYLLPTTSSHIPLMIRGTVSQSVALTEWQNSSAQIVAQMHASGQLNIGRITMGQNSVTEGITGVSGTGTLLSSGNSNNGALRSASDSQITLELRSYSATATANVLEVRSGGGMSGTVLTTIKPSGRMEVVNDALNSVVLIVKGATSQSADLQQWQDSSSVVKTSMSYDGTLRRVGSSTYSEFLTTHVSGDSVYRWTVDAAGKMMWDNGSGMGTYGPHIELNGTAMSLDIQGWGLTILNNSASQVVTTVRGFSAQTANLQEWQDSASSVLAKVDSTGLGTFAGLAITDAKNITFGTTTGTQIGTSTTQKIGFYGATPVVQGASIADPTGGATVDTEARTAINSLISRLEAAGLIATV